MWRPPWLCVRSRPELQGRCCVPWTCCWLQLDSQCRVSLWQTVLTLSLVPGDRGRGHDHNCVPGPFPAQHLWASTPGDLPPFHPTAPAWKCPHPGHSHQPDQHPFPGKESFRGRKLWLAPPSLSTSSCSCYSVYSSRDNSMTFFPIRCPIVREVALCHPPTHSQFSRFVYVDPFFCGTGNMYFWRNKILRMWRFRCRESQGPGGPGPEVANLCLWCFEVKISEVFILPFRVYSASKIQC